MENIGVWAGPLLLLPGVGLLILSTSARFGQLHDELHRQLREKDAFAVSHLRMRAGFMHVALVALYTSVAILAFSSLLGTIFTRWSPSISYISEGMMFLGVCFITLAAIQLIRESQLLMTVVNDNIDHESRNENGDAERD